MKIDWLEAETEKSSCDDVLYSLDKVKVAHEVEKLSCQHDSFLVLNKKDEHWMKFAVLSFYQSNTDGSQMTLIEVFHGEGPTGLRECRHTYWGDSGYIFYPHKSVIISALEKLSQYYDLD